MGNFYSTKETSTQIEAGSKGRIDLPDSRLLREEDVARRQGRSVKTLQNQRVTGGGIPFLKLGRSVRYRLADVVAWETAHLRRSTSEGGEQ